jgi:pyruvyl transferase EpsI
MRLKEFFSGSIPDKLKYDLTRDSKKIFIFLAADYGNLGDIAITHAQSALLKQHYPGYQVIEIPLGETFGALKTIRKICGPADIITIIGGGNMGDMYYYLEMIREFVIITFKKNRIISFPQSISFSNTRKGRKALDMAKKVYSSHKNLTVMAREENSYSLMCEYFPKATVRLTPDIALTLDCLRESQKRQGLVVCMRNDREKKLTETQYNQIVAYFEEKYKKLRYYDSYIDKEKISKQEYPEELEKILHSFSIAEIVITDRLHGMIFSYITGTPAIVLPNANKKIEESFKWIADCGYIKFAESIDGEYFNNLIQTIVVVDQDAFKRKRQYFQETIENAIAIEEGKDAINLNNCTGL